MEHQDFVGVGCLRVVLRKRWKHAVGLGDLHAGDVHLGADGGGVQRLGIAVEVSPARWDRPGPAWKSLPAAQGGVAVLLEEARNGRPLRVLAGRAAVLRVAEHAGFARHVSREKRGARRIAERELAIVAVEADTLCGKPVDVGAVCVEATGIAGQLGAHVVGH